MIGSIKPFDWQWASGYPCCNAVRVCLTASVKLSISYSAKNINHENTLKWKMV